MRGRKRIPKRGSYEGNETKCSFVGMRNFENRINGNGDSHKGIWEAHQASSSWNRYSPTMQCTLWKCWIKRFGLIDESQVFNSLYKHSCLPNAICSGLGRGVYQVVRGIIELIHKADRCLLDKALDGTKSIIKNATHLFRDFNFQDEIYQINVLAIADQRDEPHSKITVYDVQSLPYNANILANLIYGTH